MKKIWIIVSIVVLTAISTILLLVLIPKPEKAEGKEEPEVTETAAPEKLVSYAIQDAFVTNMKDSTRFVKASISLVLNSEEDLLTLEESIFIVRDKIIGILRSTQEDEYLDSSGQENLRQKIKTELSGSLGIDSIKEVYFTELVIQ